MQFAMELKVHLVECVRYKKETIAENDSLLQKDLKAQLCLWYFFHYRSWS